MAVQGLNSNAPDLSLLKASVERLGNDKIKSHDKTSTVQNAVKTISPQQLKSVLKHAKAALLNNSAPSSDLPSGAPELSRPAVQTPLTDDTSLTPTGNLLKIVGKVNELFTSSSVQEMLSQLKNLKSRFASDTESYKALSSQLEKQGGEWAKDSDNLKAAQKHANELKTDEDSKQSSVKTAEEALSALQKQAASAHPVPDTLKKQILAAGNAVTKAQADLATSHTAYENYLQSTLSPAMTAEQSSHALLNSTMQQATAFVHSVTSQQLSAIDAKSKKDNEQCKTLTFLLAFMATLLNKSTNDDLEAKSELTQKMAESAAADAQKKAKEYEDQLRKAEEMSKTMGCVGKILGWLIVAVSCISAVFTGGASLALAAVGLALAIGDEVYQAATGKSFMQEATQPLMDHVIKPLMDKLGDVFAKVLEGCGVSKDTAEMVGKIAGAVVAGVILIAGMVVGGKVLSKVFGAVMSKLGGDVAEAVTETAAKDVAEVVGEELSGAAAREATETASKSIMQRIMNSTLGQAVKKVNGGLAEGLGMDGVKAGKLAARTNMALSGSQVANAAITTAGNIVVADKKIDAAKIEAELKESAALQEIISELLETSTESFKNLAALVNNIITRMDDAVKNQMAAGKSITNRMASSAA